MIAGGLLSASGCEDSRVRAVDTGITRDSVLTIVGAGSRAGLDSFPNIYTRERYLIGGQNYEILFFLPTGEKLAPTSRDTVPWRKLAPIVMVENRVAGKGWRYLDSLSIANNIPVKTR